MTALEKMSGAVETVEDTPENAMDVGGSEIETDKGKNNDENSFPVADRDNDEASDTSNKQMAESTLESSVQSKVDFGLMMDLSKSLAESVTKLRHSEREKFAGALVVLQKAASGN